MGGGHELEYSHATVKCQISCARAVSEFLMFKVVVIILLSSVRKYSL